MELINNDKELYKLYDELEILNKRKKVVESTILKLEKPLYKVPAKIYKNDVFLCDYVMTCKIIDISDAIIWGCQL